MVKGGLLERCNQSIDRTFARVELCSGEQHDVPGLGLGDDHGRLSVGGGADRVRLIIAVEGVEGHWQPGPTGLPLGALPHQAMRDLTERAVPPAEAGTDPVRELAAQGAVRVVDADEAHDCLGWCCARRAHCNSIADRRSARR